MPPSRHVVVIGGGPAGLASALLLKRIRPSWKVQCAERSAEHEEIGWGLTLSADAFAELHGVEVVRQRIFGPPAIVHDGRVLAEAGVDTIETVSRKSLVDALRRLCLADGVDLLFERAVESEQDPLIGDADLVVLATGSGRRTLRADAFGTSTAVGSNYYVWLAAPRSHRQLSVSIRETGVGAFMAWAYGFTASLSTMIVECASSTYSNAGIPWLHHEEMLTFLAATLREEFQSQHIAHRPPQWRRFSVVSNARWSVDDRWILVGDAARTSHYSTGSGTVEAIKDAKALASSIARTSTFEQALAVYEQRRIESLLVQERATTWMRFWERTMAAPPAQRDRYLQELVRATHQK